MADEVKTKTVTVTRRVRVIINGKVEKYEVGKVITLPVPEANVLIAGNKAVAGSQKIEAEKPAPKK